MEIPSTPESVSRAQPESAPDTLASELSRELNRVYGSLDYRTWGRDMFSEGGIIPKLQVFIDTVKPSSIDSVFGMDGLLKTGYAYDTYVKDVRIYNLRTRHPEDFAKIVRGELSNTKSRMLFAAHKKDAFLAIRRATDSFISEKMPGEKATNGIIRGQAINYIQEKVGFSLLYSEKEDVYRWLAKGKTGGQRGATNQQAKLTHQELKKALTDVLKILEQTLQVKENKQAIVKDAGVGLKGKIDAAIAGLKVLGVVMNVLEQTLQVKEDQSSILGDSGASLKKKIEAAIAKIRQTVLDESEALLGEVAEEI